MSPVSDFNVMADASEFVTLAKQWKRIPGLQIIVPKAANIGKKQWA